MHFWHTLDYIVTLEEYEIYILEYLLTWATYMYSTHVTSAGTNY